MARVSIRTAFATAVLFVAAMAGCSSDDGTTDNGGGTADAGAADAGNSADSSGGSDAGTVDKGNAMFKARGSVMQVFVTHAAKGDKLALRDSSGKDIDSGVADHLGSHIFRNVPPGKG